MHVLITAPFPHRCSRRTRFAPRCVAHAPTLNTTLCSRPRHTPPATSFTAPPSQLRLHSSTFTARRTQPVTALREQHPSPRKVFHCPFPHCPFSHCPFPHCPFPHCPAQPPAAPPAQHSAQPLAPRPAAAAAPS